MLTIVSVHIRCVSHLPQAVTVPAEVASQVMVEAHKKYMLLSLMLHGYVASPPKVLWC